MSVATAIVEVDTGAWNCWGWKEDEKLARKFADDE
jgi:hypothetical protein